MCDTEGEKLRRMRVPIVPGESRNCFSLESDYFAWNNSSTLLTTSNSILYLAANFNIETGDRRERVRAGFRKLVNAYSRSLVG